MPKISLTEGGLIMKHYSKEEQAATWAEVSQDVSVIGKNIPLFTPRDNLKYFIDSEKEISYNKFEAVIRANGKTVKIKYNICNQYKKELEAVRKLYNK